MVPATPLPVSINLQVSNPTNSGSQEQRDRYRPRYPYYPYPGPVYGPGVPGVGYVAGQYPGVNTGDASIKIGDVSNIYSANYGTGSQTLGAPLFGTTLSTAPTVTPTPTAAPIRVTVPPVAVAPMLPPPVVITQPPVRHSKWPMLLAMLCLLVALGIGGYFLYQKYGKKKNANNTTGSKNTNAPKRNNTRGGNANATNDFNDFDFGDENFTPNQAAGAVAGR